MKIIADLDAFETETLFDILHHEILQHTVHAKFRLLEKEIDESRYQWHLGHAKYLEGIKDKLLNKGLTS